MYYSYAKFLGKDLGYFRLFGGFGLCNLLFDWARFIVATRKYDLIPISPTWIQLKLGPLLRGEVDKRFYSNLFCTPQDQISGIKKLYLLNTLKRITSQEFYDKTHTNDKNDYLVVFTGAYEKAFFSEILTDHKLVFKELLDLTLDQHKKGLTHNFKGSISIHVRLGDFTQPTSDANALNGAWHCRIPLTWYIQQVNQIRSFVEREVPVYVFSDGKPNELAELLALPNTTKMDFGSSIGDLLGLANSNVLITSGSTFSMWASYLGRMPVIWHKNQCRQRLYYEDSSLEVETDEAGNLSKEFLDKVALRLK
ncbi:alpha-1,2-fucosyltransferase [Floridanema aerugineum]|uniref:Alpha-1,2-fucosyltransferase n=1 Tax=Floridaenema aerugineum BLCC-F46 TaxID=3153654 RepID=A0ABV4XC63_9CYAN